MLHIASTMDGVTDGVTAMLSGIGKLLGGIGGLLWSTPRGTNIRLTKRTKSDKNDINITAQDWKLPNDDMAPYWERLIGDCYKAQDEEALKSCLRRCV